MAEISIPLAVFRVEGQRYALPVGSVARVLPAVAVSPLPEAPAVVLGVINVHGEVLPVVDLRRRLGAPPRDHGLAGRLLVVQSSSRRLVLPVDEVLDVVHVEPGALIASQQMLPGLHQVTGLVALPDGVLYVHDLDALLALDEERQLTRALQGAAP